MHEQTAELVLANQHLQDELVEYQAIDLERREMLRRLVNAQEEERQWLAHELHDQLGQLISALRLGLAGLSALEYPAQQLQPEIIRLQTIAAQLDTETDRIVFTLQPTRLDDLGLHSAIQQQIDQCAALSGMTIEFQSTGEQAQSLPAEVELAVYRIIQEALNNSIKHAQASYVSVLIHQQADHIQAIVEDNGVGFDLPALPKRAPYGLGLVSMRERAALVHGNVTIESSPAWGTAVFVRIPLKQSLRKG